MGNWERNPACDASSGTLTGSLDAIAGGFEILNGSNISDNAASAQIKRIGNRCDHNKSSFKKPAFHGSLGYKGGRSYAIKRACDTIETILAFKFTRAGRRKFRDLLRAGDREAERILQLFENQELAKLFNHFNENNRIARSIRSERVEASVSLVARTLLNGVDLRSMAFGMWDSATNRQIHFDYNYIQKQTGLSYTRILRAIAFLKRIGLVEVHRVVKTLDDGHIVHDKTQITISEKFFDMLGLRTEMLEDRKYALKKWSQAQKNIQMRQDYLNTYRKIPSRKPKRNPIQNLTSKLTTGFKALSQPTKGRGLAIRDLYASLISKGVSTKEVIEIIRQQYPPD